MKMKTLLITLISVVLVFCTISLLQGKIVWWLLSLLMVIAYLINLCISLLFSKNKSAART